MIGDFPEFKIQIRASVVIKKGEILTLCRSLCPENRVFGTMKRREEIRDKSGIICECPRCVDPTELSTFNSAIVCRPCRDELKGEGEVEANPNSGYFLPQDPLACGSEETDIWQCNRCDRTRPFTELSQKMEKFERLVKKLDEKKDEKGWRKIIEKGHGLLHPNHWLSRQAAQNLLSLINPPNKIMSWGEMEEMMNLVRNEVRILNQMFNGGFNETRGKFYF
jgi:ribosomal protein L37AE/L43A